MATPLKTLGCMLIVTGTAIGAGMLALPLVTAQAGFWLSTIALLICWAVMTFTALLILEVNLAFPVNTNFSTMARQTIGVIGQTITWLTFLLLLYALTAAYITGGSSLLNTGIQLAFGYTLPAVFTTLGFTVILGAFVVCGTAAVDRLNRGLITLKGLAFLVLLIILLPHVNTHNLASSVQQSAYIWYALPILITSYGFHIVIPSIRTYLGNDAKQLRKVILIGSSIPFVIYFLWELITLGVLPLSGSVSFMQVASQHGSIGDMMLALHQLLHSEWISFAANAFTDIAVTTSFLGVTLGLFDFIADGFKLNAQKLPQKLVITVLTYAIPILFALLYPKGFVMALGYASIFVALLLIVIPALMAWQLRRQQPSLAYRVAGGRWALVLTVLFGLLIIVLQVAADLHWLPQ